MPLFSKRLNWLYILFIFSWPLLVNLLSVVQVASASMLDGWSSPVQINDGSSTNANSPAIAVRGDLAYAVWVDNRSGQDNLFLAQSSDGGQTWPAGPNQPVTNFFSSPETVARPAIALDSKGVIYVAFSIRADLEEAGPPGLYVTSSSDGGQNWSACTLVSNDEIMERPVLAVDNNDHLYLAWQYNNNVKVAHYSNNQWGKPVIATDLVCEGRPCMWDMAASTPGVVYVVGSDYDEVQLYKSVDGGQSWPSQPIIVYKDGAQLDAFEVNIAVEGNNVYVAWEQEFSSG